MQNRGHRGVPADLFDELLFVVDAHGGRFSHLALEVRVHESVARIRTGKAGGIGGELPHALLQHEKVAFGLGHLLIIHLGGAGRTRRRENGGPETGSAERRGAP